MNLEEQLSSKICILLIQFTMLECILDRENIVAALLDRLKLASHTCWGTLFQAYSRMITTNKNLGPGL